MSFKFSDPVGNTPAVVGAGLFKYTHAYGISSTLLKIFPSPFISLTSLPHQNVASFLSKEKLSAFLIYLTFIPHKNFTFLSSPQSYINPTPLPFHPHQSFQLSFHPLKKARIQQHNGTKEAPDTISACRIIKGTRL